LFPSFRNDKKFPCFKKNVYNSFGNWGWLESVSEEILSPEYDRVIPAPEEWFNAVILPSL
jgi:hypothetical protein